MTNQIGRLGAIVYGVAVAAGGIALLWYGLNDILAMVGLR